MSHRPAIPETVRSFYDYFEVKAPVREIVQALGYEYQIERLALPQGAAPVWAEALQSHLAQVMVRIPMDNEASKREFLIAPILSELALREGVLVQVELNIEVDTRLKGNLDYLLSARQNLLVVEAKQGDMPRGMRQLAAEMIALDQWTDTAAPALYGALSVGDAWRFVRLNRAQKSLYEDIKLFAIPDDIPELTSILVAILGASEE